MPALRIKKQECDDKGKLEVNYRQIRTLADGVGLKRQQGQLDLDRLQIVYHWANLILPMTKTTI